MSTLLSVVYSIIYAIAGLESSCFATIVFSLIYTLILSLGNEKFSLRRRLWLIVTMTYIFCIDQLTLGSIAGSHYYFIAVAFAGVAVYKQTERRQRFVFLVLNMALFLFCHFTTALSPIDIVEVQQARLISMSSAFFSLITSLVVFELSHARTVTSEEILQEDKKRVEKDFSDASAIQDICLPNFSRLAETSLRYKHFYKSSQNIGGDWFHVFEADRKQCVMIGDVTGHGLAAAMMTGIVFGAAKAKISAVLEGELSIESFVYYLNDIVRHGENRASRFMTLAMVIFDLEFLTFSYTNMGHTPLLWKNGNIATKSLLGRGSPLGVSPQPQIETQKFALSSGDQFFLYTDGLVDNCGLMNRRMNRLGRLFDEKTADTMVDYLREQVLNVDETVAGSLRNELDDLCFLTIQYLEVEQKFRSIQKTS